MIIDDIKGKLVPMIDLVEFRAYIEEPFGSGTFALKKSLHGNNYMLHYRCSDVNDVAELPVWVDEIDGKRVVHVILHSNNISGSNDAFDTLFRYVRGKLMSKETVAYDAVFDGLAIS